MAKFRKKPVVIDAVRFIDQPTETNESCYDGSECGEPHWYRAARTMELGEVGAINYSDEGVLMIHTLEGIMRAEPGDWIIRGVAGEVYPCKPDIFEKTYEKVSA